MHRFFVNEDQINNNQVFITGIDVNHIKNVLRMKIDDKIVISNGQGREFYCIINKIDNSIVVASIVKEDIMNTELGARIYLFQGLPKSDKMELIIQKAVELGVYEIIPVETSRTIVKLDDKKEAKKLERWMGICQSAAKQSNREFVPSVTKTLSFAKAIAYASQLECNIIPYELEKTMTKTKEIIDNIHTRKSIGIFIGPEGGFDEKEIELALSNGITPISLGRRILRTETAGLSILSVIMYQLEAKYYGI